MGPMQGCSAILYWMIAISGLTYPEQDQVGPAYYGLSYYVGLFP